MRRVTVRPESGEVVAACEPFSVTLQRALTAAGPTQTGRIWRDGNPSACPAKAYPGEFGAVTQVYTTVSRRNQGSDAACIQVDFDPSVGASPCWSGPGTGQAHATAYLDS